MEKRTCIKIARKKAKSAAFLKDGEALLRMAPTNGVIKSLVSMTSFPSPDLGLTWRRVGTCPSLHPPASFMDSSFKYGILIILLTFPPCLRKSSRRPGCRPSLHAEAAVCLPYGQRMSPTTIIHGKAHDGSKGSKNEIRR